MVENPELIASGEPETIILETRVKVGYEDLFNVLVQALDQAQFGKGHERHADNRPFSDQPMQRLCELYGTGFSLGQVGKKCQEARRMETGAAIHEILGAIVYAAGTIIHLNKPSRAES